MYYVVQENVFREENYNNLILALKRLGLEYEVVKILPFLEEIPLEYCEGRFVSMTNIFPFGSLKLARISRKFNWNPGSQMNDNHDYLVYKEYYKENLLNYDSKIYKFGDEFFSKERFFCRPTKDTKVFTGQVFDMEEWREFREYNLTNGHSTILDVDTEIQVSSVKKIQQEIRFWIVKSKIITCSQYKLGDNVILNDNVDQAAYDYCNQMIKIFELNAAFVMDICLINNEYKIVECGCINCAGFYKADLQKLLIGLEEAF
jgi:hypothetical protein